VRHVYLLVVLGVVNTVNAVDPNVMAKRVYEFPPGRIVSLTATPRGDCAFAILPASGALRMKIVLNGKTIKVCEGILKSNGIFFLDGGKRFGYVYAERVDGELQCRVVVDAVEGPYVKGVRELHISKNGTRVCYVAPVGGGDRVFVDGVPGPLFDGIGTNSFRFSPDGRRTMYFAQRKDQWVAVIDGIECGKYTKTGAIAGFTADSSRAIYVGIDDRKQWWLGINDKRSKLDGVIWPDTLAISPVGEEFSYIWYRDDAIGIRDRNGEKKLNVGDVRMAPIRFSPDGGRKCFVAIQKGKCAVMVDDVLGPEFDQIEDRSIEFSPDGQRLAYFAWKERRAGVAIDGKVDRWFDEIHENGITFSPDSRRVAYAGRTGKQVQVVVDGKVQATADDLVSDVIFDKEANHVAYAVAVENGCQIIVDGKVIDRGDYLGAGPFFLRPDGDLVYVVYTKGIGRMITGKTVGPAYNVVIPESVDVRPDRVSYLGMRDRVLYRTVHILPGQTVLPANHNAHPPRN